MLDRTSVGCEQQNRSNPSVLRQEGGITSRLYSTPSKAVERFRNVDAERQSRARREPNVECTLANPEVRLAPGAHHGRELGPWTKAIGCSDRESGCDSIDRARRGRVRELDHHGSFAEAVRQFALSRSDGDEDWTEVMRGWFRGEDVHSRGGEIKSKLLQCGIRESVYRRRLELRRRWKQKIGGGHD